MTPLPAVLSAIRWALSDRTILVVKVLVNGGKPAGFLPGQKSTRLSSFSKGSMEVFSYEGTVHSLIRPGAFPRFALIDDCHMCVNAQQ